MEPFIMLHLFVLCQSLPFIFPFVGCRIDAIIHFSSVYRSYSMEFSSHCPIHTHQLRYICAYCANLSICVSVELFRIWFGNFQMLFCCCFAYQHVRLPPSVRLSMLINLSVRQFNFDKSTPQITYRIVNDIQSWSHALYLSLSLSPPIYRFSFNWSFVTDRISIAQLNLKWPIDRQHSLKHVITSDEIAINR